MGSWARQRIAGNGSTLERARQVSGSGGRYGRLVRTIHYEAGGHRRPIDVFELEADALDGGRPAVVFFHGGAWRLGDRAQFHPQCERLAAVGYVAATAAYSLDGSIAACARDAQAAVEQLLSSADDLGIDPGRVAVAGGSAGGHLAACLAACPVFRPSVAPAAAVLFNPVLDFVATMRALGDFAPETGVPAEQLSPVHQDLSALPPTIVFHGTADSLVAIDQSRRFRDEAEAAGARCELVEFEGREHAFFNPVPPELAAVPGLVNVDDFDATVAAMLGFLAGVLGPVEHA